MKRTVIAAAAGAIGAAGAISAAGLFAAAPAMADEGCVPNFACDVIPDQVTAFTEFNNPATQIGQFTESINPAELTNQFLVSGNCATDEDTGELACDPTDGQVPGILGQPGYFFTAPELGINNQLGTFADSINPVNQLNTFLTEPETGILNQPQTFINSITDPFGPDGGPGSGAVGDDRDD